MSIEKTQFKAENNIGLDVFGLNIECLSASQSKREGSFDFKFAFCGNTSADDTMLRIVVLGTDSLMFKWFVIIHNLIDFDRHLIAPGPPGRGETN